jgi:hypothetical protein
MCTASSSIHRGPSTYHGERHDGNRLPVQHSATREREREREKHVPAIKGCSRHGITSSPPAPYCTGSAVYRLALSELLSRGVSDFFVDGPSIPSAYSSYRGCLYSQFSVSLQWLECERVPRDPGDVPCIRLSLTSVLIS